MADEGKLKGFRQYALFALGFNLVVILWGVFLRASKSGDGCGQYWLTCHGEVIPSAPEFKTVIEFTHRVSTAIDGLIMLVLLIWAIRIFLRLRDRQSRQILIAVIGSVFFVLTEAAVGAGLVLTGNTADAITDTRAYWSIGHLINTFILLTFLTLTVWFAAGERRISLRGESKAILFVAIGFVALILVGSSGALAALSNMLFPSESLAEGLAKDLSSTSNVIVRLRLSHPLLSIFTAVYLVFIAGWLRKRAGGSGSVGKWSNVVSILVLLQIAFGAATLLMLGPIVMQLGHLLLADAIWMSFVLLAANYFDQNGRERL